MFLRIDSDLFVNLNNVFSYKIMEDETSYKIVFWGSAGKVVHTVFYLKTSPAQMKLLQEVVLNLKELSLNPDLAVPIMEQVIEKEPEVKPELKPESKEYAKKLMEKLDIDPNVDERQMTIFDILDEG